MGLSLFTYLAAPVALYAAFRMRRRGARGGFGAFRIAAVLSAGYAVALAAGYELADGSPQEALLWLKAAAFMAACSYLALLRLAATYPYPRRMRLLDLGLVAAAALLAWRIFLTDDYLTQVRRVSLEYIRFEGPRYDLIAQASAGLALLAGLVFAVRGFLIKSRVYGQQLWVMAAGSVASVAVGFIVAIYLPTRGLNTMYPLAGVSGLGIVLSASYAFRATRIFHLPSALKALASWLALALLFGAPLALASGVLSIFRELMAVVVAVSLGLLFLLIGRWADAFSRGRFGSARDEAAREELVAAIAHLDLSAGRDEVLGALAALMQEEFNSTGLLAMAENDSGGLSLVYPGDEERELAASDDPIAQDLAALPRPVVLKTDLISDPAFAPMKERLLAFLEGLSCEALVVAREGRRVVGLFGLKPKRSGADYDALDYETLSAVYGKLFVVGYYVRHVARESLLSTVEKEIGLADQIVKSVQDSVDPMRHEGVDAAYVCRSTRQLGGDLYDAVKISEHRWFFVAGDVSGKGLNASMSMVILKSLIRTLLREEQDFIKLVSRVNAFIKEQLPRGTFFAGVFGFLALDKGSVYFINCGIPAMFFRSPTLDAVIEVQGEGRMLGFVKNLEPYLKTRKLALPPGSSLIISTDGIIEAENVRGERYGKDKMVRVIAENRERPAQEIVDAVIKSASAFTDNKLEDDITLVAIKFHGAKGSKR